MPRLRHLLVLVLLTCTGLATAGPAWGADGINGPDDCPSVTLEEGPIVYTDIDPSFLPPELRSLPYDCAFDIDGTSDQEAQSSFGVGRLLVLDGASFAALQDIVRAFAADSAWETTFGSFPFDASTTDVGVDEILAVSSAGAANISFQRVFPAGFYTVSLSFVGAESAVGSFPSHFTADPFGTADPVYTLNIDNANGSYLLITLNSSGTVEFPTTSDFGFETPSVLSGLRTISETVTPPQVAFASGGAVVLGLLMVFPSRLLSDVRGRVLPRVTAKLKAWWAKRRGQATAPVKSTRPAKPYDGWAIALGGLFVASILTVFIDPRAGFDLGTLRLFGSVFAAFVLDVAIGWVTLTLLVSRLVPDAVPRFQFKPWTLALVVGAVLFTRVLHFEPGLTVGLVAGVVFGGVLATQQRVRLTLAVLGHGFVLSILAWIAYSLLAPALTADAGGWAVFAQETLAAITVAGIVALPLALLPVRGLTGYDVFTESRATWAIAYGLGLAAFLLILVPFPTSWKEVPYSFIAWLGLFVGYLVAAVIAWLLVVKPWRPESDEEAARRRAEAVEAVHR